MPPRAYGSFSAPDMPAPARLGELRCRVLPWKSTRDLTDGHALLQELLPLAGPGALVFDLAGIPWLRSHELGLLVALNKAARASGNEVMVWRPSPRVERFIRATRLEEYIPLAPRLSDWVSRLQSLRSAQREGGVHLAPSGVLCLRLPAELTAASLPAYRAQYEKALPAQGPDAVLGWEIDAASTRFLDSAAMGFLVSIHKKADQTQTPFVAMNWSPGALRILQVARLESLLAPSGN